MAPARYLSVNPTSLEYGLNSHASIARSTSSWKLRRLDRRFTSVLQDELGGRVEVLEQNRRCDLTEVSVRHQRSGHAELSLQRRVSVQS